MLKIKDYIFSKRILITAIFLLCILVVLIIAQDYLQSSFQSSSFYLSESFLFSSFWWLFLPIYYVQYIASKNKNSTNFYFTTVLIFTSILLHLLIFPILVFLISSAFFENTFSFLHTLKYTLSAHLYKLIIGYSLPILTYQYFTRHIFNKSEISSKTEFVKSILVNEGSKTLNVATADILYFEANTPYININLQGKTYLKHETLKTISKILDGLSFVRIHKSTIVNLDKVVSYSSRLNGDYDLILVNETKLRVSRNYAANFKLKFKYSHRVSVK